MPADAQLPSLIVELQNIADDAGVELASIKPSEPKPLGDYSTIDFSMSITGSYVTIIDFLRRIEKAPRAMTVNSIDISVASYPDLVLNFTVSAFTMGTPGTSAAVPAAGAPAPVPAPTQTSSNAQPNGNTGNPIQTARSAQTAEAGHAAQTNEVSGQTVVSR
jgi:hypothetical protein